MGLFKKFCLINIRSGDSSNDGSDNQVKQCHNQCYQHNTDELPPDEGAFFPTIDDVLPMCFEHVFIGNQHDHHNGRNESKKRAQVCSGMK